MNALIIVDMQEAYFKSPKLISKKPSLVTHINRLIHEAKNNNDVIVNVKTIHTANKSTWTLNMLEDGKGFAFESSAETDNVEGLLLNGSIELVKTRDSAFHETDLRQLLTMHNIRSITLTGVSTHSCIFHTASQAYAFNIPTTIVASAVGDEDEIHAQHSLEYLQREYRQLIK